MAKRKTAGELALKAASDKTKYDPLEVGYALTEDVVAQLQLCGERHSTIFDEEEYFLVLIIAGDPLIKGIRRHKYAAFLHMPKPRPEQSCYLYNKKTKKIKRLWTLPSAMVMATISEMRMVADKWRNTKNWCDAFYAGKFFEFIRKQHNVKYLSEREFSDAHSEEIVKSRGNQVDPGLTESFDFSKIKVDHIVDTKTARAA